MAGPRSIILEVSHSEHPPGRIQGFRFVWAYYVNGYKPDRYCQRCFTGEPVRQFSTRTARSGRVVALDKMELYPYVYVCGVGVGPQKKLRDQNLHFPLQYEEGHVVEAATYNGYTFRAHNAIEISFPRLPEGWKGINDKQHTGCRNFQFAVASFGYPPAVHQHAHQQIVHRPCCQ